MKKTLFFLLALTVLTACHQPTESEAVRGLDSICTGLFPADEPGAAVLVMRGDSVLFDRGYGLADLETRTPIDGNTFFNIASVSKQFTAVAVLQLAEQGQLSLNDAVAQYFPYPSALWKEVRIRHLLSHSSGVPDLRGGIPREEKLYATDSLALAYLPSVTELHFSPGTNYEYMNPTFVLCGAIVEKVSGQPFSDYMAEHIFAPAGMQAFYIADSLERLALSNSINCLNPLNCSSVAHGYEFEDVSDMPEERTASEVSTEPKNWYEYDLGEETFFATRPDGGLYTSTHEFAKWEKYLRSLNFSNSSNHPWEPRTLVSGSPWSDYQNRPNTWYGYGWFIEPQTDSTKQVIYHTGDNGGFKILAARYPEDNALVLVFANRADWDRYALMQQIEQLFGL